MSNDLIFRGDLINEFEWLKSVVNETSKEEVEETIQRIRNAPAVDAVLVIRCRECYWGKGELICSNPKCTKSFYGCPVPPEHFCSYGERSDNHG